MEFGEPYYYVYGCCTRIRIYKTRMGFSRVCTGPRTTQNGMAPDKVVTHMHTRCRVLTVGRPIYNRDKNLSRSPPFVLFRNSRVWKIVYLCPRALKEGKMCRPRRHTNPHTMRRIMSAYYYRGKSAFPIATRSEKRMNWLEKVYVMSLCLHGYLDFIR